MKSQLPGINVMLLGPTGTGKTTSLRTLIDAGITPFCVFTEPGFEVLGEIPSDKLHWKYIPPAAPNWSEMIDSADKINNMSFKALSNLEDINKGKYRQFVDLLRTLNNFKCDRTGEEFGDVSSWGTNRALCLDGLSGLNIMAMNLVVGSKPVKAMSDWGVAMDNEERIIQKLCVDTRCHFILIAHVEREVDEALGTTQLMASTLGRKLAPKLPRFFSDVVFAKRTGDKFVWSTAEGGVDTKARNLPIKDGQPPSFVPLIESWKKRGGIIEEGGK